jgi:hypothetical protein
MLGMIGFQTINYDKIAMELNLCSWLQYIAFISYVIDVLCLA